MAPTTQFRSTWLSSSIKALRERGLWERYLEALPEEHHEAVELHIAGMWLPVEVAHAHYAACDTLGLTPHELVTIGAEVAQRVHGSILSVVVKLAKGSGATPWTMLERTPRLWQRIWVGGALAVYEYGPKEAQFEIHGWPIARYDYIRHAMCGVLEGLTGLFCRRVFVSEDVGQSSEDRLVYRLSWV